MAETIDVLNIDEIKKLIPHRAPILLIDRVENIIPDTEATGIKAVSGNEPYFAGHFPDFPVMPGVLIIEAMAQAAGILGFKTMDKTPQDGSIYYFVGSDKLRFKRPVVPGDKLQLEASIMSEKRGIWKFDCCASVDGERVASATILCADRKV